MREIKYRQWNPRAKVFHYWGYIDEDDTFTSPIHGDSQQFTGLLDKQGKEIYEGDLLKTNKGIICHVIFAQARARYVVKYPNIWADKPANIYKSLFWANVRSEVIGNVYSSNPEILKEV